MLTLATRSRGPSRATVWRLAAVFGLLTFLQGVAEPTEGLAAQPVRSLLTAVGQNATRVTSFAAIVSLPWALKPLFGLVVDFVLLGRAPRRAFLCAAGATWAAVFLTLGLSSDMASAPSTLLVWLLVATSAAALADVATDALVVEWGQVHHLTGRYQAAVWLAAYASGIATGTAGGAISQDGRPRVAYMVCGICGLAMLALGLAAVREPARKSSHPPWAAIRRSLSTAAGSPAVRSVAMFVAVSNLNPVTNPVLQLHMTGALGLSEQLFGNSLSVFSIAAMIAAAAYAVYCTRVPVLALAYTSVGLGVLANLAYLPMPDRVRRWGRRRSWAFAI